MKKILKELTFGIFYTEHIKILSQIESIDGDLFNIFSELRFNIGYDFDIDNKIKL